MRFFHNRGGEIALDWFLCKACGGRWSWPRSGHILAGGAPDRHQHCPAKRWPEGLFKQALRLCRKMAERPGWAAPEFDESLGVSRKRGKQVRDRLARWQIVGYDRSARCWSVKGEALEEFAKVYEECAK